jgi:hypothetical protein
MTQKNKLIVGAVVVVLGALYLYDRSKKMKALEELKAKAQAEEFSRVQRKEDKALATKRPTGAVGLNTITEII